METIPTSAESARPSIERQFEIIRNDSVTRVNAECFVPGKVVVRIEGDDYVSIVYRVGEAYMKKVVFKTPASCAENLSDWIHEAQIVDRAEWSHLQWITRDRVARTEREESKPTRKQEVSEEDKKKYGHKWETEEFLHELEGIVKEGGILIAHDSTVFSWSDKGERRWHHEAFFRTQSVSLKGNRLFVYVKFWEGSNRHQERRVCKRTAECRYRDMDTKLEELGPLTAAAPHA
jgi:hypothetical protein